MARFTMDESEHYGSSGGAGFFSLKNDKDVAKVRFLYDSVEDVVGYAVHEIEVDGKKRYINCIRTYNEPVSKCPFCAANRKQLAKMFIPVYNIDQDKVQIWERGKKFYGQIQSICKRYASTDPLCSHIFEIERSGKAGDTSTTYAIYEVGKDNTTLADLPEVPEILDGFVINKSAEEMENILNGGEITDVTNSSGDTVRRRGDDDIQRRTPSRRGEAF